jgi:Family of unknown function (DUF5989)
MASLWVPLLVIPATFRAFLQVRMGWMLPMVVVLFVLALVLALLASAGALAPFVYPLF